MLKNFVAKVKRYFNSREEEGQSLVEYGLILALVSVVAISILTIMGSQINQTICKISQVLKGVNANVNTTGNVT